MIPEVERLAQAIAKVRTLLQEHGYTWPERLHELEASLARGDTDAVIWTVSEATGSAGSLRDLILYADPEASAPRFLSAANAQLDVLVREIEAAGREAAVTLGLRLVR